MSPICFWNYVVNVGFAEEWDSVAWFSANLWNEMYFFELFKNSPPPFSLSLSLSVDDVTSASLLSNNLMSG